MNIKAVSKYTGVAAASAGVAIAQAQVAMGAANFQLPTPSEQNVTGETNVGKSISTIAEAALTIILTIAGVLAVFYLIYSGILYITAGGNAERTKQARSGIINAVIGIIVILAAFFIVRFATSVGQTIENTDASIYISTPIA